MTAPKRIQRHRTKNWRMPNGTIYVGRPTKWGNPFVMPCRAPGRHDGATYRPDVEVWHAKRVLLTIAGEDTP